MVVSEFVEGLFEEAEGLLAGEAELGGFDGELRGKWFEATDFFGAQEAGRLLVDVASATGDGADDAVALEVLEGAGDGVGVDAEFGGEFADGGQEVVVVESAGGDGVADLVFDLEVDGDAGGGMDAEQHLY
jgi:hypothetical protein